MWRAFGRRLGDLVLAARRAAVGGVGDGPPISDTQKRIADLEPAAGCRLSCTAAASTEPSIDRLQPDWPSRDDAPLALPHGKSVGEVGECGQTERALVQEAQDLARSNALLAALSQVATRIAATIDPDQILETLGHELKALGLICCVIELDADDQAMVVRYISIGASMLVVCREVLGIELLGYRIPLQRWSDYEDTIRGERPTFVKDLVSVAADALSVPRTLLTQVIKIADVAPDGPATYLPLTITDQSRGAMIVWGPDLHEKDLPALTVFANQVASVLESARLYAAERRKSIELARTNAFLSALSQVSAHIGALSDLDCFLAVLGTELERLGITCFVALLTPDGHTLVSRYASVQSKVLDRIARVSGLPVRGLRIPLERWPAFEEIRRGRALFIHDPTSAVAEIFPGLTKRVASRILKLASIPAYAALISLPLSGRNQVLGMLSVWGPDLREEDIAALTVFAGQVATALENARLYAAEHQRSADLARSNTFVAALSRVAARIGTTLDLDQVLETLGTELRQIGLTCIVALREVDPAGLVFHYTSIESKALAVAERVLGLGIHGFRMTRECCPFWEELVEQGQPVFVPDAVAFAASSLPSAVHPLIESVFRMGGWTPQDRVLWLPMAIGNQVRAGIVVWGPDVRDEDLPALSVFASQVGFTIESARLYAATRQRAEELVSVSERLSVELEERSRAEQQVRASLQEKEVLLKEIHHRVKNNLQIISSLLRLQSASIEDEQLLSLLVESQNRVKSMALVHEKLYQTPNMARIDFAEYIQDLANQLFHTYRASVGPVHLRLDIESATLDIDAAISCGLVVNELVSNALKHGFPDQREGTIEIQFRSRPDGAFLLRVSDDGVGLPDDLDVRRANSLGLQLIDTLVDQLDGTMRVERERGTAFEICLPAS